MCAFGAGEVTFFRLSPALLWVMMEPPNIKAVPIACKTVNVSCIATTARNMANGTCS